MASYTVWVAKVKYSDGSEIAYANMSLRAVLDLVHKMLVPYPAPVGSPEVDQVEIKRVEWVSRDG